MAEQPHDKHLKKFMLALAKNDKLTNEQLIMEIQVSISMVLFPVSKDTKLDILDRIAKVISSDEHDDMELKIKRTNKRTIW